MKPALLAVASLLSLAVPAPASDDELLPGRDGKYQFEPFDLEGTVWQGRLIPEADMIVRFERGGVLYYKFIDGGASRKGSWKQTGGKVYFETLDKYAEYTAVIRGDNMIGEAHNVRLTEWKWKMERLPNRFDPDNAKVALPPPGGNGK